MIFSHPLTANETILYIDTAHQDAEKWETSERIGLIDVLLLTIGFLSNS